MLLNKFQMEFWNVIPTKRLQTLKSNRKLTTLVNICFRIKLGHEQKKRIIDIQNSYS